jgi:hypothetical protein
MIAAMHIEIPDRHHLAMRGRVPRLLAEIATAGEHLAITHDHRAEGVIAECGFCNGHAHEACVRFRRRLLDTAGNCPRGNRQRESADRACDQVAPAYACR